MQDSELDPIFRELVAKALHTQQMDQKIALLERQVESLLMDREKTMRWGIMALGAAVLGLATWIFNFLTGHIK